MSTISVSASAAVVIGCTDRNISINSMVPNNLIDLDLNNTEIEQTILYHLKSLQSFTFEPMKTNLQVWWMTYTRKSKQPRDFFETLIRSLKIDSYLATVLDLMDNTHLKVVDVKHSTRVTTLGNEATNLILPKDVIAKIAEENEIVRDGNRKMNRAKADLEKFKTLYTVEHGSKVWKKYSATSLEWKDAITNRTVENVMKEGIGLDLFKNYNFTVDNKPAIANLEAIENLYNDSLKTTQSAASIQQYLAKTYKISHDITFEFAVPTIMNTFRKYSVKWSFDSEQLLRDFTFAS